MGIPAVIITALPTVAVTMGANRVVHGVAITHPVGRPDLSPEREVEARQRLVERALEMLTVPVDQGTVWEL
jgi:glycine reductase